MAFGKVAAASLVFGILYAVMFVYMCGMYATKRYKWKSRFTILFIHAAIRVASQVSRGASRWAERRYGAHARSVAPSQRHGAERR